MPAPQASRSSARRGIPVPQRWTSASATNPATILAKAVIHSAAIIKGSWARASRTMSGETVASWAVSEPGRGWAPLEPSVTATQTDAGYRIDGTKDCVEAAAQSALLLVMARGRC